jgi:S1-C subfamily serine protease
MVEDLTTFADIDQRSPATAQYRMRGCPSRLARSGLTFLVALMGAGAGSLVTYLALPESSSHSSRPSATTTTTTLAAPIAGNFNLADLVARVQPSVVSVETLVVRGAYRTGGAGTGIILTADGQVLTNAHVVAGASAIRVSIAGIPGTRPATVIGADPDADLALLRVDGVGGLQAATIGSSSGLRIGSDVVAIGNALNLEGGPSVTHGIVSALGRTLTTPTGVSLTGMIQTDAAISSGNSGGPLVDMQGRVIGVNTAAVSSGGGVEAESISFAIPIDRAVQMANSLRSQAL